MRQGRYADRVGADALVYLAAVIEYLSEEILDLSSNRALKRDCRVNIHMRDLQSAISCDKELTDLLNGVMNASDNALPNANQPADEEVSRHSPSAAACPPSPPASDQSASDQSADVISNVPAETTSAWKRPLLVRVGCDQ